MLIHVLETTGATALRVAAEASKPRVAPGPWSCSALAPARDMVWGLAAGTQPGVGGPSQVARLLHHIA